VSTPVEDYVVDLVRATRERPELRLGSSPRSSVALYRAAQARAYLAGRDFVLPDDVKALAPAVLGHRVLLDIDRELRGSTVDGVIDAVLASVAVPPAPGVTPQNPA
jgi:MoxR-like ATPase